MSNQNNKSADRPTFKGSTVLKEFKQEVNEAIVDHYPKVLTRVTKDLANTKLEKYEELLMQAFARLEEFETAWKAIKADLNEYDEDGNKSELISIQKKD